MRIAIPSFEAPDNFEDNVAFTLRQMGHQVFTRGTQDVDASKARIPRHLETLRASLLPNVPPPAERWLISLARRMRIDVVLAITRSVSEETLFALRRLGVGARIAWWGDTPQNMARMGLLSAEWDLIFLKDPDTVAKFRCLGLPAGLLHEAMNPAWHRPVATARCNDVVVAGSAYGYRQFMVKMLLGQGVSVAFYGPGLPTWSLAEVRAAHRGRYIVKEEKSRIFGEGLACLNGSPPTEGNSLNCRAFEIAGAGGLQLFDFRPLIAECFEPGKEILVFHSFGELLDLLRRAAAAPEEMRRIREAGARRALAEHTYRHRLETILRATQ